MSKDKFEKEFRQRAKDLVGQLTQEEKLGLLTTHHQPAERLGLGEFFIGTEIARGFVGREPERFSTVLPQPIGLAGTFDTELMEQLGEIAGNECRAYYNKSRRSDLCVWGPTVDMERDPRWGRTEEAYGEDVCLAGEMTRSYTLGLSGLNKGEVKYLKTIPTLKHFCANNNEHDRASCNAYLPLRLKYEYYYAAFMNAIKFGGARSVMSAYNEINGIPGMCNPELDTVLKKQWGMWFAVTDGGDFSQTVTAHRYCEKHSEALAEGLRAGCDTMTDSDTLTRRAAEQALADGLISWEDIDRSIENTLYARLRLGQLDADCPYDSITTDIVDSEDSRAMNLRAAKEQVVLLKNSGLLPLKNAPEKIAVVGPLCDENLMDWYTGYFRNAVSPAAGVASEFRQSEIVTDSLWDIVAVKAPNGKYLTVHEDGTVQADADSPETAEQFELQDWGENWNNLFSVKHQKYVRLGEDNALRLHNRSIYDWFTRETFNITELENGCIIEEFLGSRRMTCEEAGIISFTAERAVSSKVTFQLERLSHGSQRARKLSEECGLVIYCTGNYPVQVAKECYDRKTLALNIQPEIPSCLSSGRANLVVALISSYPYAIADLADTASAVIYSTHAGAHLGTALAETISGKNNPAGRLAMTWYRSELDLPDIMNYDIESGGTTYMYFRGTPLYPFGYGLSYSAFEYSGLTVKSCPGGGITAEVTVKNTSDTDGDEAVQLYFTVTDSAVSRPIKKLCAFARVHIRAGEEQTVRLNAPEHIFQFYDVRSGQMMTEDGTYRFTAGGSSADTPLAAELHISGEKPCTRPDSFEAQFFESGSGAEIGWSRTLKRQLVKSSGWGGTVVYGGVPFTGKNTLTITAASYMKENTLNIEIAGHKLELDIAPSNSKSDFAEYSVALPEGLPDVGELVISLPGDTELLDICVSFKG